MKDLIAGSLGRLDDAGDSSMFAVPRTIYVPPEYEIETDVPSVAEFVTCSLDGRLWVFRRSRRYYVAALRFNELTQKLVFVSTTVLNNTTIVGRGISWVLTDKQFIQALDNEPYVGVADLFADNADTFLYSSILSDDVSQRSNYLQSVGKDYSLLPTVGDWTIVDKFLIHKPTIENGNDDDNEDNSIGIYHSMSAVRPLIPLEFYNSAPVYGNSVSLANINGELWARGKYAIGKCSILPAVFDENGNPQEFYLYVSPDYKVSPYLTNANNVITQSEWSNLNVFGMNDAVYGFLTGNTDSLVNGLCHASDTLKLFIPSDNEWLDFEQHEENEENEQEDTQQNEDDEQQNSSNSKMFVDTLNQSGLVLENDKVSILNGLSYECKGLRQWVAPTGNIETITSDTVISSFDKITLATHIQQEFYREQLASKTLPFSLSFYSNQNLSLSCINTDNKKTIQINSINEKNKITHLSQTYKSAVEIKLLNIDKFSYGSTNVLEVYPDEYTYFSGSIDSVYTVPIFLLHEHRYIIHFGDTALKDNMWSSYWNEWYIEKIDYVLGYIHPLTGKIISFKSGCAVSPITPKANGVRPYDYYDVARIFIIGKTIYYCFSEWTSHATPAGLVKLCDVPSDIFPLMLNFYMTGSTRRAVLENGMQIRYTVKSSYTSIHHPIEQIRLEFLMTKNKILFNVDIANIISILNATSDTPLLSDGYLTMPYYESYNENFSVFTKCLHILLFREEHEDPNYGRWATHYFLTFFSELHPEIFDFNAELERSKLT